MEQNTPKFRLKLNLFDGIVLVLALAVGAFLLWRAVRPAAQIQSGPTASSTVRYTIRFQRWLPGTSELIQPKDRIADNIKNYEIGQVVSVQTAPALIQTPEDVLVTVEAPCTVSDKAITVGGGYEVRAGSIGFFRGEGYMGSGPIVSVEEVQG